MPEAADDAGRWVGDGSDNHSGEISMYLGKNALSEEMSRPLRNPLSLPQRLSLHSRLFDLWAETSIRA